MRSTIVALAAIAVAPLSNVRGQELASKADAFVKTFVDKNQFIGSVLIARDGKPIFRKSYGLANVEWNIPNAPDTKFRLGSITKQFTATAIMQLVEAGKLRVDDPISKYYDSPEAWSKVTIHHLLTHTSGIPSYTSLPNFFTKESMIDRTPAEIIKLTQDMPLEFAPGEQWKYDNTGYILLGFVIEKITGQKYADYVQEHIFGPLGMHNTGYDTAREVIPHRASGYNYSGSKWLNAGYLAMSLPYAAGSLYSTVDDLLIWDQALYAHKPLTAASLDKMFTPYKHEYGYGWGIDERAGHKRITHGGGINGFNTEISRFPNDRVTIIVLANMNTGSIEPIGKGLAEIVFAGKADPAATTP